MPKYQYNLKVKQILESYGINSGNFNVVSNFYINILGNQDTKLYISEISPTRREVRLKRVNDLTLIPQWNDLKNIDLNERIANYVINFGANKTFLITNWVYDEGTESYIIKLYEPLLKEYVINDQLWISYISAGSSTDTVSYVKDSDGGKPTNVLAPNFNLEVDENFSSITNFETWDSLLSSDSQTQRELIVENLSQSKLDHLDLKIDYTNYENFVHFSSAQERVDNFKYKMQLMELYQSQSDWYNSFTAQRYASSSKSIIDGKIDTLKAGFSGFDKYLYYQTSSYNIDTYCTHSVFAWPKYPDSNAPFWKPYSYTSSQAEAWYISQSTFSNEYDRYNLNNLVYQLPQYIKDDDLNSEVFTYLYMVGEFFDTHWLYIKHLKQIYVRDEELSIAEKLLPTIAGSFGLELIDGNDLENLWRYTFGFNEDRTYTQDGFSQSLSYKHMTSDIWKRLLNNLPFLLKTKGTKRGISALLNCYGIPNSVIAIKEYGGPNASGSEFQSTFDYHSLNYGLEMYTGTEVTGSWRPQDLDVVSTELRFKYDYTASIDVPATQTLLRVGDDTKLNMVYDTSTYGWLELTDGTDTERIGRMKIFDGDYWNVAITYPTTDTFNVYLKKGKYGQIVYNTSSLSLTLDGTEFETNGVGFSIGDDIFSGSVQEFRQWTIELTDADLINHTKYIRAINTVNGDPYTNLVTRYSFDSAKNHGLLTGDVIVNRSVSDIKPNQSWLNTGSAEGYDDVTLHPYNYNYTLEEMSALTPDLGIKISNKIRIEENYLDGNLDINNRADIRSYDYAPIDSNKLSVTFSPTDIIDKDIIAYYADSNFDNFIGDPRERWRDDYYGLREGNLSYWNQYENANNFWDYIQLMRYYNMSLFDLIRKNVPARAKLTTGITIEPHILNRPKVSWKKPSYSNQRKSVDITYSNDYNVTSTDQRKSVDIIYSDDYTVNSTFPTKIVNISESKEPFNNSEYDRDATLFVNGVLYNVTESVSGYQTSIYPIVNNEYSQSFIPRYDIEISSSYGCTSSYGFDYNKLIGVELLGYDKAHHVNYRDESTGYLNARYNGCVQTENTTVDGKEAVEITITNPNKLVVGDEGNDTGLRVQ